MNRNLLIVTTNFPPAQSIGTQRILKICKFLSATWNVHVLTHRSGKAIGTGGELTLRRLRKNGLMIHRVAKIDLYSAIIAVKDKLVDQPQGNRRRSPPSGAVHPRPAKALSIGQRLRKVLGAIIDFLAFPDMDIAWLPLAVVCGTFLILRNNIDTIFASGPRHSNLLTAVLLKRITGRRLVVDFRDPWARSPWLVEKRRSSALERFKHRLIRTFERKIVETADSLIFITRALRDDFSTYYSNLPPEKFNVYYNGFDPDRLAEIHRLDKDVSTDKQNRLIFSHIGNLYKKRNPEQLVRVVGEMVRAQRIERGKVLFRFVGGMADDIRYVEALVKALELGDMIEFLPTVGYKTSFAYMQDSDVLMILQPEAKLMLPAKFYDYICFDKPILALGEPGGEVQRMVQDRFGCFADYDSDEAMQKAILELIDDPERYRLWIVENRDQYDISRSIDHLEHYLTANAKRTK